jgi:acetyl coenzyme A synthetase (ADP forming)-like protein
MESSTITQGRSGTARDQDAVREVLEEVRADGRDALSAPEAKRVADAYGIPVPKEGLATSGQEAVSLADDMGYPVVLKIVSPDILHKTEAKGVLVGVSSAEDVSAGFDTIVQNAKAYKSDARITGVQVQQMLPEGQEVLVGAIKDPSFGPVVTFGLGGILVEVLRDVTFRLAPTSAEDAADMVESIKTAEVLHGVRGRPGVDRKALADIIQAVSELVADFPEITEVDLNPVLATEGGATAVDARFIVDFSAAVDSGPPRYSRDEILATMTRMFQPRGIAVVGASEQDGKIGNSVMKNLVNGGFEGEIYPINPKAETILGKKVYKDVSDLPDDAVDLAVFCIPAKFVVDTIAKVGDKGIAAAVLIPSGFSETGEEELQRKLQETAREHNVRFIGPNIYGIYYLPQKMSAAFTTPYDVVGSTALASQSGGIGMGILGFARSTKLGVAAIVGLGNKADIDEDDLLTFFEQDDNTQCVALHMEDLKDGRSFVEVAQRVSKKKPIVVLKAGATPAGSKAAASHTAALAGDDKVYDDILRQAGVVRANGLRDLLELARALPVLPTPTGENVVIITGAGGSGVLLSDACYVGGLQLMEMPDDLNEAFMKFIPPFGAAGNPVDITGGEPPETYANTIRLGLEDERIHSLVLGYWHTIITPPMTFAKVVAEVVEEYRNKGIEKPVVASLAGDVEVEEASQYLFERGIPAYPYTTETPVEVLAAKYRWARMAGLLEKKR